MNTIRPDFPKQLQIFFRRLKEQTEEELYFYGSASRSDYIHGQSDIDVAIFTDNEFSTISKISNLLKVSKTAFDKVVWKLEGNMLYGYKLKCDKYINSKCEISVFNREFQNILIPEITTTNMPIYISVMLYILKLFHYTIPIIPNDMYDSIKRYIFNVLLKGKKNSVYHLIKH